MGQVASPQKLALAHQLMMVIWKRPESGSAASRLPAYQLYPSLVRCDGKSGQLLGEKKDDINPGKITVTLPWQGQENEGRV